MLVLVSVALAAVAFILLVVGFVAFDGLALIYASVLCSAAAGVVLYIAVRRPAPTTGDDADATDAEFPIADYDVLTDEEVLRLLPDLTPPELALVAEHERAGARRASVLDAIAEQERRVSQ
jgi:hypothetical protein